MILAVERAQRVLETISQDTSRTTGPLLRRLVLTLLPPLGVFLLVMIASGYLRVYLESEYQDSGLNTLTAISTSLLTIAVAWWTIRWTERRFGGMRSLRQLLHVVGSARLLEREIAADQDDPTNLEAQALQTWEDYRALVDDLGLTPPAADPLRG